MIKKILRKALLKSGYDITRVPPINQEQEIFARGKSIIYKISPEFKVLNGPFKGLQYPSIDITESTLVPKIAGSYEAQLNTVIEKILYTSYSDIIDIGSAEGYYAVGFASRMPDTVIHCYDINERDLNFCKSMAKCNNVTNLTFNNFCSSETLINFNFRERGFILCDCEGYELELFSNEVIQAFKNVDLLIELHDNANPVISAELLSRFQYTHNFEVINNLNVIRPLLQGLETLSEEDKEFAIFEHRGGFYQNIFMEWAFLTSKSNN